MAELHLYLRLTLGSTFQMLPKYRRIPDAYLDEFIAIYKEEYGEEIGRADAHEMTSRLVMLYALLSRKLPEQKRASTSVMQPEEDRPDNRPPIGFRT